ncbi:MAG: N,N-dimethylformamidase beta subunit family domain-containing protein [Solirubrobacteraceae bacterium]
MRASRATNRHARRLITIGALLTGLLAAGPASAAVSSSYPTTVFADGFESGSLSAWTSNPTAGPTTTSVTANAAHSGAFGARLANGAGAFNILAENLAAPAPDSSVSFALRVGSSVGVEEVAQARDASSSQTMWTLYYDGGSQAFWFYPASSSGGASIFTGTGTAPLGTWTNVEIRYRATVNGGAQILLNGQSQAGWSADGDYTRSADFQKLQLWNDGANTVDFDDVSVATATPAASPPGAPGAPSGQPGNGSVALSWSAPSSDGGSPITGYRITPYIGTTAQTPILTGSTATSRTITGLANGTSYTFKVAAINAAGTGPDSVPSPALTPVNVPPSAPGAPSGVSGTPGDGSVALTWTAPSSDGGSPITGYRVTPYVGSTAQPAISTGSTATSRTITGLANGTSYTFKVAAINAVGTGADSTPSSALTPTTAGPTGTVFSDGFESGSLSAWDGNPTLGTGSTTVVAAAAHGGQYGARLTTSPGGFNILVKNLPDPLYDSSVRFAVRIGAAAGVQEIAQGRDISGSATLWTLYYDGTHHGFWFYPNSAAGGNEIWTGNDSAAIGSWIDVKIRYQALSSGGAQLYLNGLTQPSWGVSGDFRHTANLQKLQLWNDGANSVDFDDVVVAAQAPPAQAPLAPGAPTGVPGDAQVALDWTAPGSDGGSAITGYRITPYLTGVPQTATLTGSTSTHAAVTGLTNESTYTFTVAAINGVGTGADSASSAPLKPTNVPPSAPAAPSGVSGTAGDGAVALTWTAPTSDGGAPVTGYRITPYVAGNPQAPILTGSTATSFTAIGLVNGTDYTFSVAAINGVGTGVESPTSGTITPRLAGPSTTVFSDGFETGSLSAWDANPSAGTGSTAITDESAHSGSLGLEMTNSAGAYQILVKNFSSPLITSSVRFASRVETPAGVQLLAQARDAASSQTMWSLYYDGTRRGIYLYPFRGTVGTEIFTGVGSVPLNTWFDVKVVYDATATGGAQLYLNGVTQPAWSVSGDYTRASNFQKLQIWNDVANSTEFDDVTVKASAATATAPGAPANVTGSPGDATVTLNWDAPTLDGGSPLTGYRITPYIGTTAQTPILTGTTATSRTITGLTNGTAYTFRVAAINAAGTGSDSTPSSPITPTNAKPVPPDAPTSVSGTAGDASVALTWSKPGSDGGSAITGYRITPYESGVPETAILTNSTATSQNVTGLTNGHGYTFTVAAINAIGTGPESAPSATLTPKAPVPPGTPGTPSAVAGDGSVAVDWTAPTDNGGAPITGYRVTPYVGATAQTPTTTATSTTSANITGLTNGTTYTFKVAAINSAGPGPDSAASNTATPVALNPIQVENQKAGDSSWGDVTAPPDVTGISGYGSQVSLNHGSSLDLYVTTTASSVKMDVFRMGWYGGTGARLVKAMGTFPGVNQPQAKPNATTGMVAENWTKTTTLDIPASWTTGVYLVRLMASSGYGSYIYFVVRNDGGHEPLLLSTAVDTYAAYDTYGGTSLYNNNTNKSIYTPAHAVKVSFDRPFATGNGAGQFLWWEYPMVRWLEKNGYNVTYTTNIDTSTGTNPLTNHRAFLSVGHDEYWTKQMRDNVQAARDAGVNIGFFSANSAYWQVRLEPNAAGSPNRVVVGYKDFATCTCDGGPDPYYGVNNSEVTTRFRDAPVNRPEDALIGVMFGGEVTDKPYVVQNATNWVYQGSGFSNATSLPGLVGYEYDHYFGNPALPSNLTVLSNSPVVNTENNKSDTANSTVYTAPSGATVFASGTIQWSYGLDNFGGTTFVNAGIQRTTANILARFQSSP